MAKNLEGLQITLAEDEITLSEFSGFFYNVENIWKQLVFLKKGRLDSFHFRHVLPPNEDLIMHRISKNSPFEVVLVPTITYGELIGHLIEALAIIIALKQRANSIEKDYGKHGKEMLERDIEMELRMRQIPHNKELMKEMRKLTLRKTKITELRPLGKGEIV